MRRRTIAAFAALLTGSAGLSALTREGPQETTRLAVVVVVDQLRADLLDRYDDLFEGGFRRLRDQGFRFTNATHDHWWTETAPGHTALATGTYPSSNGIVLNDFFVRDGNRISAVYSFDDPDSPILGLPDRAGRSPANMRRSSFAEWLVGNDPDAHIATVSRKDRAAIPLAGRTRATALWMDIEAGRFVTSRYYASEVPSWLGDFNARVMPFLYSDSVWTLRVPPAAVSHARRDSATYENGGQDVSFPHRASARPESQSFNAWMAETPVPDLATLLLARRMTEELELGKHGHMDFLGISLSQTDAIGHNWGPLSLEQLDNLLRLDRTLGQFLDFLDEYVGPGRWVLALSADHGVMTAPEYLAEQGEEAWRLTREQARSLSASLTPLLNTRDSTVRADIIAQVETDPLVADVVTLEDLRRGADAVPDSFFPLLRHSYTPDRTARSLLGPPDLVLRYNENVLTTRADAASHGTPYYYDRHVPLVFFGPGIRAGSTEARAGTVDLAPTLAELLGLPVPDGLDGVSRADLIRR